MNLAKLSKDEMQAIIAHKNDCLTRHKLSKKAAEILKTKTKEQIRAMLKSSPDEALRGELNRKWLEKTNKGGR